jgi:glycosyltransferase involved in cell wall biosynthesis
MYPKVSIIVPVYGVEKYIERCARSLFEQTLDNIEFIFVNDCTKDNSIKVLEQVIEDYPNRKNQITILHHEENNGLPQARKTGILQAKGEYIAHCDSDDWVEKDMYRAMYEKAKNEDADMVFCDYCRTDGINKKFVKGLKKSIDKYVITNEIIENKIGHSACMCIAKGSIYSTNPIVYPKGYMGEDYVLTMQLLYYSQNNIGYLNFAYYNYWINPNSKDSSKSLDIKKEHYLQKVKNYDIICQLYMNTIKSIETRTKIALIPRPKNIVLNKIWKTLYPDVKWYNVLFNNDVIFKNKIKYFLHLVYLI